MDLIKPTKEDVMQHLKYLRMLSHQYPNIQSASTEIINLQAILGLPKGTEHFMSDLHGEYEAFIHIRNSASGAIREKVDALYQNTVPAAERAELSTLIYYPKAKLQEISERNEDLSEWYKITLNRLMEICRLLGSKYTRSKVRKALPEDFAYIIDELINLSYDALNKQDYYANILSTIIDIDRADDFIIALCTTIKRLIVDRLHIVGDIFDRGPRADIVLDCLMEHHCVDIQWGNHDILWMGAATGSRTCVATVLNNSITYNNLEVIEGGYGISLRPLALFANEVYKDADISRFMPRTVAEGNYNRKDLMLGARMHKAIAIIQFKLEGQIIKRHPEYRMDDRMLLHRIDYEAGTIEIEGKRYPLTDCDFPTVDRDDPYALTEEEALLMRQLKSAFQHSEKLQRHVQFLYSKGSLYKCFNKNLLFHGCIPLNPDGSLMEFSFGGQTLSGRGLMDYADAVARRGYYAREGTPEKQYGKDFLWFLWCGRNSPLCGRKKIATFERLWVDDPSAWEEPKNAYYRYTDDEDIATFLLGQFGLGTPYSHIINGHMPVKAGAGESPIKAGGKLIVIDGGFCRAYQSTTGIAGYTLIYNSYGLRLCSHEPFAGLDNAIKLNKDILSTQVVFDRASSRIKVDETDAGEGIRELIADLKLLLAAYRLGVVSERHDK
ncbi:fructose-1,6-bisphosphatase [Zongyangia hominis]|uniref:Fructose-1,6-bisphosphatase class 3 n=1 Tax=Zongyangia hominis TaxID=2763677 RepID=A0A926E9W0_9FIRM|nr:fructose-1,6-bisphosphatase [Zongyangia hominis]MBC8569878.1 fructose-1,6-bisphosphatase [Zongyangia hominis]